jgi:hypothetical protein
MALQRSAHQVYDLDQLATSAYVRKVLAQNPAYSDIRDVGGNVFSANIKPSVLMLGSDMKITVAGSGPRTDVTVSIHPQAFILGDIFGFYERYAADFLRSLCTAIRNERGSDPHATEILLTSRLSLRDVIVTIAFLVISGTSAGIWLWPIISRIIVQGRATLTLPQWSLIFVITTFSAIAAIQLVRTIAIGLRR